MPTRLRQRLRVALIATLALFSLVPAVSATPYTDPAAFAAAVALFPGTPASIDFDSTAAGTTIPNGGAFGGITFTLTSVPLDFVVSDFFDTTSGENALGVEGGDQSFIALDEWDMSFGDTRALGLYIISSDPLFEGDIELVTSAGTATNSGVELDILPDGGLVYFIGIVADTLPFSSAQVRYGSLVTADNFIYNVDDITRLVERSAPEPSMLVLALAGAAGLRRQRRRRSQSGA